MNLNIHTATRVCLSAVLFSASLLVNAGAQTLGADRPRIQGSLTLSQAVETGLRENLMVRAARSDWKAARAGVRIARSQTMPQISTNTYLTYGDFSNIFSTAPNVTPVNNIAVPPQGYADQNLSLTLPLY